MITVGGGKEGFDGLRVGLQGFDNPFRDEETHAAMTRVGGACCKITMDSDGFVEVVRTGKTEVSVHPASDSNMARLGTLSRGKKRHMLETDLPRVLFDMTKLKRSVADSMMYHGNGSRNRMELEREVNLSVSIIEN